MTLVNRMVDVRPCNVIDVLRRVRNCRTIIIIIIITQVSRYQKGKTNLDLTEARDSEWQ